MSVDQAEGLSPSARRPEHGRISQGTGRCRSPTLEREETPFFTPLPAVPASWASHVYASEAAELVTSTRPPLSELTNSSIGQRTCPQKTPVGETPEAELQADPGHIVGLAERSSTRSTSSSARRSNKHSEAQSSSGSLSSPASGAAEQGSPSTHSEAIGRRLQGAITEHETLQTHQLQGCQAGSSPGISGAEDSVRSMRSSLAEVSKASNSCGRTDVGVSTSACSSSVASARGASQLPGSSFWGAAAGVVPGQALQSPLACPHAAFDAQGSHLRQTDPPSIDADALCLWPGELAPASYSHCSWRLQSCLGPLC